MHKGRKNQMAQKSKNFLLWKDMRSLRKEAQKVGVIYTSFWMVTVKVDKDTKTVEVMPYVYLGGPE
jgi:hypothetical protein